jgi:hypothetical protein
MKQGSSGSVTLVHKSSVEQFCSNAVPAFGRVAVYLERELN